jgi:hypothetical protein
MAEGKETPPARKAAASEEGGKAPAGRKNIAAALAKKPSRKVSREMLVLELRRLRALFSEIAERYLSETEAGIVAAIAAAEGKALSAARIDRMLARVHRLSVKPRKGRRKDLARIEKVVASLRKELEE